MNKFIYPLLLRYQNFCLHLKHFDGIAALSLRLFLIPVFWMAGSNKLAHFADTVEWFGNPDWGLGLPFPTLMAILATSAELGGAILLALGLATRWISIPLMITMLVAIFTVHLPNGWQAREILMTYGNYDWLTSSGSFVILNNGIEFAATYFVMLLALIVLGGGRYVSVDYWLNHWIEKFHGEK